MKKSVSILLAIAFLASLAAVTFAGELKHIVGSVKAADVEKGEVVIAPYEAKKNNLPKKVTVKADRKKVAWVKGNLDRVRKADPKNDIYVNAGCETKGKDTVARNINIVAKPGC